MSIFRKPKIHNQKFHIPRVLLTLCFIVIMLTLSLSLSQPIKAQADTFTGTGSNWKTVPGKLEWAGSAEKQGVLFYLYNLKTGSTSDAPPFAFLATKTDSNGIAWRKLLYSEGNYYTRLKYGLNPEDVVVRQDFPYPATYTESGTWVSNGGNTKAYLEEELPNGKQRWEDIVGNHWSNSIIEKIKRDRGETYRICMESISAFVPYINDGSDNKMLCDSQDKPFRLMMTNKTIGSIFKGIDISTPVGSSDHLGTPNSKWIQSISNGMVYFDEEDSKVTGVPIAIDKKLSAYSLYNKGYGFATIKPIITPIHTCNGSTPGDPEKPKIGVTDGECTIQKVYWTTYYDKDGNYLRTEPANGDLHTQSGTTNYIVIDSEPGYTVKKWQAQKSSMKPTPNNWNYDNNALRIGKGGGEVVLNEAAGEKCLNVWLEKIEVDKNNDTVPYEYIIPQSQIAKRISFQDPDNTETASAEKMQTLRKNPFTVKAGGVSECGGHNCDDPYCESCPHYCSGEYWPDNTTKIGIRNTKAGTAPSILSKHQQTTSKSSDLISDSGNTFDTGYSRSGTWSSSLSYSGYRYNCIIFRGKDQLVLADWKNNQCYPESKSFLTNIAVDSRYNVSA